MWSSPKVMQRNGILKLMAVNRMTLGKQCIRTMSACWRSLKASRTMSSAPQSPQLRLQQLALQYPVNAQFETHDNRQSCHNPMVDSPCTAIQNLSCCCQLISVKPFAFHVSQSLQHNNWMTYHAPSPPTLSKSILSQLTSVCPGFKHACLVAS